MTMRWRFTSMMPRARYERRCLLTLSRVAPTIVASSDWVRRSPMTVPPGRGEDDLDLSFGDDVHRRAGVSLVEDHLAAPEGPLLGAAFQQGRCLGRQSGEQGEPLQHSANHPRVS